MDYYKKYQKYKFKYLNLLNQSGGDINEGLILAVLNNPLELINIKVPDEPSGLFNKDYNNIILEAVIRNGLALKYVDKRYIHTNLCLSAIAQNPDALEYVIEKNDIDDKYIDKDDYFTMCKLAVEYKGSTVRYVNEYKLLEANRDVQRGNAYKIIWLKAVQQDWKALEYIDKFMNNYLYVTILKEAVKNNSLALQFIDASKFNKEEYFEICKEAVTKDGLVLQYVKQKSKIDANQYEIICALAIKQNQDAVQHKTIW
jgi:hypothetical protein